MPLPRSVCPSHPLRPSPRRGWLRVLVGASLVLLSGAGLAPVAAGAGQADAGGRLARQWCAACHVVAQNQDRAATIGVPSFFDIAANPDMTREKIETFLADPHPKMPDMGLSNPDIRDLAAYIVSLRP
ncbi:cytochrome C552 [Microvirga tunisiensis]|uniref:Cytochrome C552 n=1 Tax=Pannonibacter tanglangensis TaxID=2750084 RepID=A0ABW9ZN96_9HYPH|nr:cytochrome C552 [Pannonibacter sp. XCT-34]